MAKGGGGEAGHAFRVREARVSDLRSGLLETLSNLSDVRGLDAAKAGRILSANRRSGAYDMLAAVTAEGDVVGAATLLVEQKLTHGGGKVGHIEDVAVREGFEGRGVGSALVNAAVALAEKRGCYKVILDCKEDVAGFYERLGFRRHEIGMRMDLRAIGVRGSSRSWRTGT